ncbi:MAG: hypothetical protein HYY06_06440 [Deltaproteobacteria bacterium]|nr:hypothetical protein [Deltaproteobacteria bacterium]
MSDRPIVCCVGPCAALSLLAAACGGESSAPSDAGPGDRGADAEPALEPGTDGGSGVDGGAEDPNGIDAAPESVSWAGASCDDPAPSGAALPPAPRAYTGGSCPVLLPGANTIATVTGDRQFLLVVPRDLAEGEALPLTFLWHWLGASAQDFLEKGAVQEAADQQRFLAAIPESKGDTQFKWPYSTMDSDERMEEEFVLFDDILACVAEQYAVNTSCVSSVGVSAGALFTAQLAGGRGEYLSSILVLSGGTGGALIKDYRTPAHKMPAMVLWGGPDDNCFGLMNFVATSGDLEAGLREDGHFILECIHNCGHAEPPMETESSTTKYQSLWDFVLQHPYWLADGASPWIEDGVPESIPTWCAIGAGNATPREGECTSESGC